MGMLLARFFGFVFSLGVFLVIVLVELSGSLWS